MSQPFRLAGVGSIDRSRPLVFTFDGLDYQGYAGDTLASALIANGVHLVGRSFKYHRPRGILTAGAEEPNALVSVDQGAGRVTPNLRATQIELYDGLRASSQNCWPSLKFDFGAVNDLVSPLFGAGFYYKTFMGPSWAWRHVYEPMIRRAAGLGHPPRESDPDRYQRTFGHCDVLVVGAGPAGLAAALSASPSGARVVVCDENPAFGGSLLAETEAEIDGKGARDWLADALVALRSAPNVRLMPRTQAFGYYAQNFVGLNERIPESDLIADPELPRERLWQMRAREVVLATGAIERPLVFPDNDRPAVMLAGAARRYCNQYGARVGDRVVVATAHDSAYRAALDLNKAGVHVELIADLRSEVSGPLPDAARAAGIEVAAGAEILGVDGRLRVKAVRVRQMGKDRTVACDALLMSGGWTPSVHLFSQSRGKLAFDEALQLFKPGASAQRERSAGACNAAFDLAAALVEGDAAGREAATGAGFAARSGRTYAVGGGVAASDKAHVGKPGPADRRAKAFVDFQNDVCAKDVSLAVQEGMRSIEHIKRYTTTGMATDQGKLSNMNALGLAAAALGKPIPEVGLNDLPPALYAGDFRRLRRPCARRRVRSHSPHAHSRMGGRKRRRVRGCQSMEARLVFSAALARRCRTRSLASAARRVRASACSTPRRSARSKSSVPTRRRSLNAYTPTPSRSSRSGAAATASC